MGKADNESKRWLRVDLVMDDERLDTTETVTALMTLAHKMGEEDEVAISDDAWSKAARVSLDDVEQSRQIASAMGWVVVASGAEETTYKAAGPWLDLADDLDTTKIRLSEGGGASDE